MVAIPAAPQGGEQKATGVTYVEFALIGFVIGIITTAPVGPVNIMAIQHAAQRGFRQGLYVGLGAVVADTTYAAVAVFGVSAVTRFIEGQFDLIKAVGVVLLFVFGLKVMTTHPHLEQDEDGRKKGFWGDATAAFFMAITNPGVVLAYIAIVGGLGDWRPQHGNHIGALAMVAGVAAGATTWWATISWIVSHFSAKIDDHWLDRANFVAGIMLIVFGLVISADLAVELLA
jgi:threonine/homoserine/homoserine lactone efflux protein